MTIEFSPSRRRFNTLFFPSLAHALKEEAIFLDPIEIPYKGPGEYQLSNLREIIINIPMGFTDKKMAAKLKGEFLFSIRGLTATVPTEKDKRGKIIYDTYQTACLSKDEWTHVEGLYGEHQAEAKKTEKGVIVVKFNK